MKQALIVLTWVDMIILNKVKVLLILLVLLHQSSCTNLPNEVYIEAYQSIRNQFSNTELIRANSSVVNESKYSFISVKIGNRAATLTLSSSENGQYRWVGKDSVIITSEDGQIIFTSGLDHNVDSLSYLPNSTLVVTDFLDPYKKHVVGYIESYNQARDDSGGLFIVKLIDYKEISTIFKNSFIYDSKGMITESKQEIHPNLGKIEMYFYFK